MALADRDKEVLLRCASAFKAKGNLDSFWQEVAEHHYPERAQFTTSRGVGDDPTARLYSSEPVLFRREFGNFLGSVLRPRGRKWFSPAPENPSLRENTGVKQYLEPKGELLRALLYNRRSNYTRAMSVADHDYSTFGNSVGSARETVDGRGLTFRSWHLRDCAWLQNDETIVDTMFRRFKSPVRELLGMQRRGWTLSPKVTDRAEKKLDSEVSCIHVQMPVWDYDYTIKRPKFEWVSLYYDEENSHRMSFKLVPEFDYYVDRWFLLDGYQYAVSPCVICSLPDSRSLQTMTWSIIEAGEKAVEPPLVATHEAIQGGVNAYAGGLTWVDRNYDERSGEALRALELGGNPQFGEVLRQSITQNLNAAWFLNKLFMPQTYDKTAYEANRLHEEFMRAMYPIIEPAEAERNGNHLDIVFKKSIRMGLWGDMQQEMPKELRGENIEFTYDNPMEDSRKQDKAFTYKSAMELVGIAAQYDKKDVVQFNHTEAFRDAISGISPPSWVLDDPARREALAQAEEDETTDMAAQQAAMAAEAAAKAQPKTPVAA